MSCPLSYLICRWRYLQRRRCGSWWQSRWSFSITSLFPSLASPCWCTIVVGRGTVYLAPGKPQIHKHTIAVGLLGNWSNNLSLSILKVSTIPLHLVFRVTVISWPFEYNMWPDLNFTWTSFSFLIEASTPFVSLRVILVHLQMKVRSFFFLSLTKFSPVLTLVGWSNLRDWQICFNMFWALSLFGFRTFVWRAGLAISLPNSF